MAFQKPVCGSKVPWRMSNGTDTFGYLYAYSSGWYEAKDVRLGGICDKLAAEYICTTAFTAESVNAVPFSAGPLLMEVISAY
jgi:hypothetical protein